MRPTCCRCAEIREIGSSTVALHISWIAQGRVERPGAADNKKEADLIPPMNVDVTHVIQLAIAPVFLLTAVGTIIGVLSNRLSRIVDRIRVLEERPDRADPQLAAREQEELVILGRRLRLVYLAVTCEVFCGLFVGLVIAVVFADAFLAANLAGFIATVFVLSMLAFIGGLGVFLREIFLAVSSTRDRMR
jgi:hypothetical protein